MDYPSCQKDLPYLLEVFFPAMQPDKNMNTNKQEIS